MNSDTDDQVIALAALTQACLITSTAARRGFINHAHFAPLVHSLFNQNPVNTLSVYGSVSALRPGLETFVSLCRGQGHEHGADLLRYQFGLIYLERQLAGNQAMLDQIGFGLESIGVDFADAEARTDQECINRISALYQDSISTLRKRIQVQGDFEYLQKPAITTGVRTALLAGIRAAVLWRQVGGRRWQLLLQRKKLLSSANGLLAQS